MSDALRLFTLISGSAAAGIIARLILRWVKRDPTRKPIHAPTLKCGTPYVCSNAKSRETGQDG